MAELSVVRRYARALFDTASRSGMVEQVEDDLKAVDQVLRTLPRLLRALRAPTIPAPRKEALLDRAFGTRVGPLAMRFLKLAVQRRREDILSDVYLEYHRMANEARGILPVQVTAAVPMADADRDDLAQALHARTGKQVVLQVSIDPGILGGLVLRMGDTVLDGSVRTRLEQLRARLLAGRAA
jgi:F-type H+-transporting ATPase subunit delta